MSGKEIGFTVDLVLMVWAMRHASPALNAAIEAYLNEGASIIQAQEHLTKLGLMEWDVFQAIMAKMLKAKQEGNSTPT